MSGSADWQPKTNPWIIALVVTMAAFMEILDTTIVNVALPHVAGSLSASNDDATWALTSYLVANGIVLPISGWLSSVFGRKRYFIGCIAGFTICSFLCGISTSLPELIVFRALQGFCGGGLQPSQQAIILDTFPADKRGAALSITAIATVIAPVLGPTLGGWITDSYSWRWIFYINVPVGVATVLGVLSFVEDPPWEKAKRSGGVDYIGIGLIALGLGSLQVMLDRGEDDGWFGSSFVITFAVLAYTGIVGAAAWLLMARRPVVKLAIMADRNFAVSAFLIFAMFGVLYSSAVLLPQLAQQQLNYTATWAGLMLSPGALLVAAVIPCVGWIMGWIQTRIVIAVGFVALGVALVYSYFVSPQISFGELTILRAEQSFGLALLFVPINTAAFLTIPKEDNADAAALFVMFRNLSGSIGISLATAMVTERTQVRMAHLVARMTPFDQGYVDALAQHGQALTAMGVAPSQVNATAMGHVYQTLRTQAAILGYSDVFLYCAALAFVAVPIAFLLSGIKGAKAVAA